MRALAMGLAAAVVAVLGAVTGGREHQQGEHGLLHAERDDRQHGPADVRPLLDRGRAEVHREALRPDRDRPQHQLAAREDPGRVAEPVRHDVRLRPRQPRLHVAEAPLQRHQGVGALGRLCLQLESQHLHQCALRRRPELLAELREQEGGCVHGEQADGRLGDRGGVGQRAGELPHPGPRPEAEGHPAGQAAVLRRRREVHHQERGLGARVPVPRQAQGLPDAHLVGATG